MPGETSSLYQAHLLPSSRKSIRVLDILPIATSTSDSDNETIKCHLHAVAFDDQPKFTALSYVWGSYSPVPDFIICDDVQVKVTSNCHSALRHLRKKLEKLTIWIDAVCINQDDLEEKSRQIPLMGDIYSLADCVYIWLGDGTDATDRAMAYMAIARLAQHHLEKRWITRPTAAGWSLYRTRWHIPGHAAAAWPLYLARWNPAWHPLPFSNSRSPKWWSLIWLCPLRPLFGGRYTTSNDLEELLSKSWITRLWTFQELLLAAKPIVVCGDAHVPWFNFERSLIFLDNMVENKWNYLPAAWISAALCRARLRNPRISFLDAQSYRSALDDYKDFAQRVGAVYSQLWGMHFWYTIPVVIVTLLSLYSLLVANPLAVAGGVAALIGFTAFLFLHERMKMHATDPGLFSDYDLMERPINQFITGLCSRTATNPKDMAFGMWAILERGGAVTLPQPDYSHNVGDIYRTFTAHIVHMTKDLDILLLAVLQGVPGQPSWVPDWSANSQHEQSSDLDQLRVTRTYANAKAHSRLGPYSRDGIYLGDALGKAHISFNEARTVLTVRAYQIGEIATYFRLHPTSNQSKDSERNFHIDNVRSILSWVRNNPDTFKQGQYPVYQVLSLRNKKWTKRARENMSVGSALWGRIPDTFTVPGVEEKNIEKWLSFFHRYRDYDPSEAFSAMRSIPSLFTTHSLICNRLVEQKKDLFCMRSSAAPSKLFLGTCLRGSHAGDPVLSIVGLDQLLVARVQDAKQHVKLVSSVVLLQPPDDRRRRGSTDYHIC